MSTETSHLHLTRQRRETPFVGRTAELDQLTRCFTAALQGERRLVLLSGEPGIGKTTLVEAFRQRLETGD